MTSFATPEVSAILDRSTMANMTLSEVNALLICANASLVTLGEPVIDLDDFIEENNIDIIDECDAEWSSESDYDDADALDISPLDLTRDHYQPNSPMSFPDNVIPSFVTPLFVSTEMERDGFFRNNVGKFNEWDIHSYCRHHNYICVCEECEFLS
tara:strand:- start:7024 stop:7488 length:465 start_codon:yes stop_codon:yes gene_type:complete